MNFIKRDSSISKQKQLKDLELTYKDIVYSSKKNGFYVTRK